MRKKLKLNEYVRIIPLLLMGLFLFSALHAQQNTVRGIVKDDLGEPVMAASVYVKGTTNGTVTDIDGNFTLSEVPLNAVISVSFIGYTNKEVTYTGQSFLNIMLSENTELLDEVVVIGYGQVRKSDATGSLTTLKADASVRGFAPNAQDMMTGKIAGVQITNAGGEPTGKSNIRIRGGSSLSASNDPLIIIDGVPLDNEGIGKAGSQNTTINLLSTINPTDIESFTVLKDASATAIYGSRASNGVILITMRKGAAGRTRLTYDGNVSVGVRVNEVGVLNGNEFRDFVKTAFAGATNYEEVVGKLGNANTDWQDEIFRTAVSTEHNISAYGSVKDVLPFRISAGYNNYNGILKTSNMERYTASISLTPSLLDDHLRVNLNAKGMYSKNRFANKSSIGNALAMNPTQPVYDENSKYGGYYTTTGSDGNILAVATKNPLSLLELKKDVSDVYNFIGSAQFDYKLHFLPELRLNLNLGIDYSNSDGSQYIPEYAPEAALDGGFDGSWDQTRRNSLLDFYAQYAKDLNFWDSRFDIMGGYSWQHYWRKGSNADYRISKFDEDGNPEAVTLNNYETENYLVSFFGRLNYSMFNKYLFTFTLRNDGSSRFNKDNRWGLFPSAALAWRLINEDFMANLPAVSDMKVRLGWGITGQQDIKPGDNNEGDYPYMGRYEHSVGNQAQYLRGYTNGQANWSSLLRPSSFNPDLKWETTTTYNMGIDYGLFKNRVYGSFDYYYRKTKDLINLETKVAAGTNFSEYVIANIGSLKNQGAEFSVNGVAIQTKDLNWEVGVNFAYNKNKITSLSYNNDTNPMRRFGSTGSDGSVQLKPHAVGYASGRYYVYEQVYD
ncbi:MAG: SusC/RagA family TonB-linked outer membrane protein, partial [Tannerellaceae bacterium]|nr:SusC/RagA family TonB-linked outer membrane protein [Tannerellaceae bacterium]